jgi:MFS family permease
MGMFAMVYQQHMGLTMSQIGVLGGIWNVGSFLLLYFGGVVADRYHPLRTLLLGSAITTFLITPIGLIWLFANPSASTFFYISLALQLLTVPVWVLTAVSLTPTEMRIFPRERYGQFCSANSLVRSVGVLVGGQVAGVFLDAMKHVYHGSDVAYRYIPAWQLLFQAMSFVCLLLLYREWKRLGGDQGFAPPDVDRLAPVGADAPAITE